jgi:hypothetical protein
MPISFFDRIDRIVRINKNHVNPVNPPYFWRINPVEKSYAAGG